MASMFGPHVLLFIILTLKSNWKWGCFFVSGGFKVGDEILHVVKIKKPEQVFAVKKQMNTHKNISDVLDNLLSGYDNRIRPDFGGPPAIVEVDIMVRSMGPISEIDMTYSMDLYFRQPWIDKRLAFKGNKETLALSITMLEKIWKPDTYFYNGKQSYLHSITTPNKFVRLYQDGRVLYSSRLTIKAGCPMNLENFPMDTQRCPLKFGSFGYTTNDVVYKWNSQRQIVIAEDMKLSQFDLIANISANETDKVNIVHSRVYTIKEYSMLLVSFHLQRHMGNFLIQVYGPCILLVVLSWVSFWLNREATADRVSLGITTVLTMTFLGLEARTDLPKVPYPTALDFFVFLSFAFIFATIIQFAVVHYFTKYGSGECYFGMDLSSESGSDYDDDDDNDDNDDKYLKREKGGDDHVSKNIKNNNNKFVEFIPLSSYTVPSLRRKKRKRKKGFLNAIKYILAGDSNSIPFERSIKLRSSDSSQNSKTEFKIDDVSSRVQKQSGDDDEKYHGKRKNNKTLESINRTFIDVQGKTPGKKNETKPPPCLTASGISGNAITQNFHSFNSPGSSSSLNNVNGKKRRRKRRIPRYNSVSKIDKMSRIVFPMLFAAINVLYWYSYLIRSERIHSKNK
nr:gamma-aminobutyric acid receptor GRD2 [Pediculus humanus corporis]